MVVKPAGKLLGAGDFGFHDGQQQVLGDHGVQGGVIGQALLLSRHFEQKRDVRSLAQVERATVESITEPPTMES